MKINAWKILTRVTTVCGIAVAAACSDVQNNPLGPVQQEDPAASLSPAAPTFSKGKDATKPGGEVGESPEAETQSDYGVAWPTRR